MRTLYVCMDPAVAALERASQQVLNGEGDETSRQQSNLQLIAMAQDLANIPLLQRVLDQSNNSFAILAASNALTKLVTDNWNSFTEAMRVQIRACALGKGGGGRGEGRRCPPACARGCGCGGRGPRLGPWRSGARRATAHVPLQLHPAPRAHIPARAPLTPLSTLYTRALPPQATTCWTCSPRRAPRCSPSP